VRSLFFAPLCVASLLLAGPQRARADDPAAVCTVRVVKALHSAEAPAGAHNPAPLIDPRLEPLKPYLEKAPFTSWHEFKLLEEKPLHLQPHGTARFMLPNGRQVTLTYVDHLLREDNKHRLRLQLGIHKGDRQVLNTTFVVDEGGVVVQAGQQFQKCLLILGISCDISH
jgi:hypothetical protein